MTTAERTTSSSWRVAGFWILQVLVVSSGFVWARNRYREVVPDRNPPVTRREPLEVRPLYDVPEVISDAQLNSVLHKLKPRLGRIQTRINHVDHALRFWGIQAEFDEPECLSGIEMRDLLLDHRQFSRAWGADERPFLMLEEDGLRVRTQDGSAAASHVDHTLACLAEAGTPLDYPVITPAGEMPLVAIFDRALRDFSLNQEEYEWSALVMALYVPAKSWISTEGQEINFDRLADRLMRQRLKQGVCRGNHRLHTLTMLLRINEQHEILTAAGRERIIEYLQDVTRRLVETQKPEGYWDDDWPSVERDGPNSIDETDEDPLAQHILLTGHAMEWWSLAPEEVQPPRETLVKAGQWLTQSIEELSPGRVKAYYTFLTHAGRALALWRGKFPHEVLPIAGS